MGLVTVRGSGNSSRVALWEVHADHPKGEIFLAEDSGPMQVGETTAVLTAIRDGRLVRVEEGPEAAPEAAPEAGADKGKK